MTRKDTKRLSSIFNRLIRERDKVCQVGARFGGCGGVLQCSHIHSVGAYKNLQFHPTNAVGMCWRHHFFFWHKNPVDAFQWVREYLGDERWKDLEVLRRTYTIKDKTPEDLHRLWKDCGLNIKVFHPRSKKKSLA